MKALVVSQRMSDHLRDLGLPLSEPYWTMERVVAFFTKGYVLKVEDNPYDLDGIAVCLYHPKTGQTL